MKEIIFYGGFAIVVPIGVLYAASSRFVREAVFVALIVSTSAPFLADINILGRNWYRGTTRGIEISYVDAFSIILLASTILTRRQDSWRHPAAAGVLPNGQPLDVRGVFWPVAFMPMVLYFAWASVTVLISYPHIFGIFELSKIIRGFIVFLAVAWFVRGPREIRLLVYGLFGAAFYVTARALQQRYIIGSFRVSYPFAHPNLLSMYCCAITPVALAVSFSNLSTRIRSLSLLVTAMMVGCVLLSISRTGYATVILTGGLTLASILGLRFNTRNIVIVIGILIVGSGMLYKSWDSVMSRLGTTNLENEYMQSGAGRGMYIRLARLISDEHPLGIGLNNWSWYVASTFDEDEAGTRQIPYHSTDERPESNRRGISSQTAPAHNLAALTLGELGWPGLLLMLTFWGAWGRATLGYLIDQRPDMTSRVLVGISFGMFAVFLHNFTEWAFRDTPVFLLMHIYAGVASAMCRQRNIFLQAPRFAIQPARIAAEGRTKSA